MGVSIATRKERNPDTAIEKPSGCSLARLFGVISPKISTITVITAVEIVVATLVSRFERSLINQTVAKDESVMFTMLLPTRRGSGN